jgi:hypothetical protein
MMDCFENSTALREWCIKKLNRYDREGHKGILFEGGTEHLHEALKEELGKQGGSFLEQIALTTALFAAFTAIASLYANKVSGCPYGPHSSIQAISLACRT